ncbi:MAG: hypothetical protein WAV54_07245 [Acidimicrobiales bacterium]
MTGPGARVTGLPLAARCALAAYPGWWRERYGQDQERFLEDLAGDGRPLFRAVTDLAYGAVRVRLRPAGMPQTVGAWRDRARASIAWATVPALAVLLLVSAVEQHSFGSSIDAGPSTSLSPGGRVAADAMSAINSASVVILLLLLVGWGLVGCLADRAPSGRARKRWLLLTTAPLAAGVVEIGLNLLRFRLTPTVIGRLAGGSTAVAHGGHPLAASVVSVAWDVVGVAGLLSIFCVVLAVRSADLQVRDLRGGVWLSQLMAIVLLITAVAVVAWGIGVTHQPPIPRADLIGSGPGVRPWTGIQTSIAAEWPLVSAGLVAISIVTAWAALSARRSYKAARELILLEA